MDIFAETRNSKIFIERIGNNPSLLDFWDKTQNSMPKIPIQLLTMSEVAKETNTDSSKTHYAFCTILPMSPEHIGLTGVKNCAIIAISDNSTDADIAHELAHFYVHFVLGYPWSTSKGILPDQPDIKRMNNLAAYIYSVAVHPIIDNILKEHRLFNYQTYNRMSSDYINELNLYLKNPLGLIVSKEHILIRSLELMLRLPSDKWDEINSKYISRNSFKKLLRQVGELPQYPIINKPDTISQYITDMCRHFSIDTEQIGFELRYYF